MILISLDTVRADHLSLYGYGRETTPELEALADECLVFEQAYTTAPWTQPAHMSLFTGLYPMQHEVQGRDTALADAIPTLAERLREAGYRTAGFYSPGWIDERYGFGRGFDLFRPHEGGAQADRHLREWMEEQTGDEPFFLFLHVFDAHNEPLDVPGGLPYDAPGEFATTFLPDARERLAGISPKDLWTGAVEPTPEQLEAIVALYDGGLRYVDHLVGTWVAAWRRRGILDRALLIVTSDHGEPLGQRDGKLRGHGQMWEEGLHVPLVLRLPAGHPAAPPSIPAGGLRRTEPVSLVDVVPTVLEVLGLDPAPALPGRSLLGERAPPLALVAQHPSWSVARYGPYKYVVPARQRQSGREKIYHLERDRGEERPLEREGDAAVFERVRAELGPLLGRASPLFLPRAQVQRAAPLDAEGLARLRNLGYAGD